MKVKKNHFLFVTNVSSKFYCDIERKLFDDLQSQLNVSNG